MSDDPGKDPTSKLSAWAFRYPGLALVVLVLTVGGTEWGSTTLAQRDASDWQAATSKDLAALTTGLQQNTATITGFGADLSAVRRMAENNSGGIANNTKQLLELQAQFGVLKSTADELEKLRGEIAGLERQFKELRSVAWSRAMRQYQETP